MRGKVGIAVLLVIGMLGVMAPPAAAQRGRAVHQGRSVQRAHPSWMSWLPDSAGLGELSLPGTHDTMSGDFTSAISPWAETQTLSLTEQLRSGIRVLDIRVRQVNDQWRIHHGDLPLDANFNDVAREVRAFLRAHPTETVLMRLGMAGSPEPGGRNVLSASGVFRSYRRAWPDLFWVRPAGASRTAPPRLGDVRGKVVVLRNWSLTNDGFVDNYGLSYGDMAKQDEESVPYYHRIDEKWRLARDFFLATDRLPADRLRFNYLSGTGGDDGGIYAREIANGRFGVTGMGEYAIEWLLRGSVRKTGVVMMDYPGSGLIGAIIGHNLRHGASLNRMQNDFPAILQDVYRSVDSSGDDEARDRLLAIRRFVTWVYPAGRWHVLAAHPAGSRSWGTSVQYQGLYGSTGFDEGYGVIAFTSQNTRTVTSTTALRQYVDGQVGRLSGDSLDRARRLAQLVRARFPYEHWAVYVKRKDFGFDNWAYALPGVLHRVRSGDHNYVVWGYTPKNRPPTAEAGGPYRIPEGSEVALDGRQSTDPDGQPLLYRWDVNADGAYEHAWSENRVISRHTIADNFTGQVRLEVSDGAATATDTALLNVYNVAPTVAPIAARTVNEGDRFDVTGTFTDPGADQWTATVQRPNRPLEPLRFTGMSFTVANHLQDDGVYDTLVRVTDDDGESGSQTYRTTVRNVVPTITSLPLEDAPEGEARILLRFTDPGIDSHTVTVDWGDPKEDLPIETFTVPAGGRRIELANNYLGVTRDQTFSVKVKVHDDDGGTSATAVTTVTVS